MINFYRLKEAAVFRLAREMGRDYLGKFPDWATAIQACIPDAEKKINEMDNLELLQLIGETMENE